MGLWDKLMGEFIDVIEWLDDSQDTILYRFERHNNEIKNGAKLTVRESQVAVFVNEGQIADVFKPGMYELTTQNLPILTTLKGWKYSFSSPFKAEVYFVNTKQFTNQKWGTKSPVAVPDPRFEMIQLRAFGNYAFRVKDPAILIKEVAGTDGHFTIDEVTDQLRNLIVTRFINLLTEKKVPFLELGTKYNELSLLITDALKNEFEGYGIELTKVLVENISVPDEVQAAINKKSSMRALGDLGAYTQYQTAEAMVEAAKNPGNAGGAMGVGMGFVMAQNMGQNIAGSSGAKPPPLPGSLGFFVAVNGAQTGPYPIADLAQQAAQGALTRETLVWQQGMASWMKAGEVAELSGIFGAVPPPIPD